MLNQFGLRCDPGIHINQGLSSELASKELRHVQRPELDCLYMYCHTAEMMLGLVLGVMDLEVVADEKDDKKVVE